jgi:hypothetical protein
MRYYRKRKAASFTGHFAPIDFRFWERVGVKGEYNGSSIQRKGVSLSRRVQDTSCSLPRVVEAEGSNKQRTKSYRYCWITINLNSINRNS